VINEWAGRLGNNLMQLSNGIFICQKFNCKLDYPPHKYLNKIDIDYSFGSPTSFYVSRFYDHKECKGNYPNLIDRRKIFQDIILDVLTFDLDFESVYPDNELVIQVRSGDVFKKFPSAKYVPSPLSLFQKIIDENQYKKTKIVCENLMNPCIEALTQKYPSIDVQSSDLESDLRTLVNAENLCITVGTFGLIVCLLSKKLKNLYVDDIPKEILDFGFFEEENQNLPFKIHKYRISNYIPFKQWRNSENQRNLLLALSRENIKKQV
jgi:hypothetical protein